MNALHRFGSKILFVAAVVGSALHPSARAQVLPATEVEDAIEQLVESLDAGQDGSHVSVEHLLWLARNPIDLNAATAHELEEIPALNPSLARAIVAHRQSHGPFSGDRELLDVPGMHHSLFARIQAFVQVRSKDRPSASASRPTRPTTVTPKLLRRIRFETISRVTRRLNLGPGFDDDTLRTTYAGGPERMYLRVRAAADRRVSLNLTVEKDPGERWSWTPSERAYGFDHTSMHISFQDFGWIHKIIVGDFVADFGQGLVLAQGFVPGRGRDVLANVTRSGRGLLAYGSTEENAFFRGMAATATLGRSLYISGFGSRRSIDASLNDTKSSSRDIAASSLGGSGLHRTAHELARRDAVTETLVGGDVSLRKTSFLIGAVGYRSSFDTPIQNGDQTCQQFSFAGRSASVASAYGRILSKHLVVQFEVGRDQSRNVAATAGMTASVGRNVAAAISIRRYPRSFTDLHGAATGEQSGSARNEHGVYLAVEIRPAPPWRLTAYFDHYRFPWARFGVARPSVGHAALMALEFRPRDWFQIYLQARSESRERGYAYVEPRGRAVDALRVETRESFRAHTRFAFNTRLSVQTRLEAVRERTRVLPNVVGVLLYTDVHVYVTTRARLDLRMAYFDAESHGARVFTYEYDLRGAFAVPSFSGQGTRSYVMLTWMPSRQMHFQLKYGATVYEHRSTVGSGLDEAKGNALREIRAQLGLRM